MNIGNGEIKKLFSFKDIYIGFLLCIGVLTLFFSASEYPNVNFTFWIELQEFIPRMGFWFIAIMIIVGLSRFMPYERDVGVQELSKTYKYGKTKLIYFKILTVFIYSFLVVTVFYLIAIVFYGSVYPIGDINMTMSKVHNTNLWSDILVNIGKFNQLQFLLYEYVYMIFATFSFGLFVVLISLLVKNGPLVMAICGGAFAIFEFYDKFIASIYLGDLINYVFNIPAGFIYKYGYNGMLSFYYFRTLDLPQIGTLILYIFTYIAINIGLILIVYRRKERC